MSLAEWAAKAKIRMLGDCVLVEMLPDPKVITLIIAPATAYKRPDRARVISAGPDSGLHEGDEIILDPYRFEVVLSDGALANSEGSPYAGIGDRAIIRARGVHVVVDRGAP